MSLSNWKYCSTNDSNEQENGVIQSIQHLETSFQNMIVGIVLLLIRWSPALVRRTLRWFMRMLRLSYRIMVRLSTLSGVVLMWVTIVFAPACVHFNLVTSAWALIAILGSFCGLRRRAMTNAVTVVRPTAEEFESLI